MEDWNFFMGDCKEFFGFMDIGKLGLGVGRDSETFRVFGFDCEIGFG